MAQPLDTLGSKVTHHGSFQGYTPSQISTHTSRFDVWIIINSRVYDVTRFMSDHPGGPDMLMLRAGGDASADFLGVGHSGSAQRLMRDWCIGYVIADKTTDTHTATQASNTNANTENKAASATETSTATSTATADSDSSASRKHKIYTKTGDMGMTSLFNQQRKSKHEDYFEALGDVDELNANMGLASAHCLAQGLTTLVEQLTEIQSRLFDVGSAIATPLNTSRPGQLERAAMGEGNIEKLEQWIDQMEEHLPALTNFILPCGGVAASALHVCRTVCRRAERQVVPLVHRGDTPDVALRYLNRLSDYLFVAARLAAHGAKQPEYVYKRNLDNKTTKQREIVVMPPATAQN